MRRRSKGAGILQAPVEARDSTDGAFETLAFVFFFFFAFETGWLGGASLDGNELFFLFFAPFIGGPGAPFAGGGLAIPGGGGGFGTLAPGGGGGVGTLAPGGGGGGGLALPGGGAFLDMPPGGGGGGGAPGARPGGGGPLDDTPPGVPGGGAFLYMPPRGVRSFLGLSGPSFLVLCDHKARSKRKQQKQKWTHCGQVLKILQIVVWAVLRGFFAFLPPTIKAAYNSLSAARVNKAQKKGNQARATQRKEGGREGRKEGRKEGQIKVK